MSLINKKKAIEISLKIPLLKNLNELIIEAIDKNKIKNEREKFFSYYKNSIHNINNNQILNNISSARTFAFPSSIYGHRYGKNINAEWDLRKNNLTDLYTTDENGFLKNNLNDESILNKINYAKKKELELIYFFGGSTMMSMGAVTPNFSIPSLVERILKKKYQKDVVCINYGLGGTCSREALDLYIHEARMISRLPKIIFYDGWNCASYLSLTQRLLDSNNLKSKNIVSYGDTMRTIEHNYNLSNTYNLYWHLSYVFKLSIAKIYNYFSPIFPNKINNIFALLQSKFFSLNTSKFVSNLTESLDASDLAIKNSMKKTINKYIDIHECANSISGINSPNFIWAQQPLVFWGKKPLSKNEKLFKSTGLSSGDPRIFYEFEKCFNNQFKSKSNSELHKSFYDLTGVFDNVDEEVYIDSGHINRLGNLIISASLSEIIFKKEGFLK